MPGHLSFDAVQATARQLRVRLGRIRKVGRDAARVEATFPIRACRASKSRNKSHTINTASASSSCKRQSVSESLQESQAGHDKF